MHEHIPSSMNINTQHQSLFQIIIWIVTLLIKEVFHPVSCTVDCYCQVYRQMLKVCRYLHRFRCIGRNTSCAVGDFTYHLGLYFFREMWFIDCSCKSCNLGIAHMLCNFQIGCSTSRLECNLRILRMRNAISRLLGTYISSIMFGFTYPAAAWCMVCMVSGVCFRGAGAYVLSLLVLGWAHSVTHSVGVSLRTPGQAPQRLWYQPNSHCVIACTSVPQCCAYRMVHRWINEGHCGPTQN